VVGLGVAILFQRYGTAALAARRQADDYIARHAGLGMREMVSRWLTTVRGKMNESLDEDGLAFHLELPDGQRVDVYIRDAQGAALSDTSGLMGRRREIVELMNYYLDQLPQEAVKDMRRAQGPSEVSIDTATTEVLTALAASIVGPEKAADVVRALEDRRDRQTEGRALSTELISRALSEAQVEPEQIAEFNALLTAQPTLWFATVELWSGSKLLDRAGGLIEINATRNDPFNQNGPFLTWDALPLEEAESVHSGR
jgi:hypothetical protein